MTITPAAGRSPNPAALLGAEVTYGPVEPADRTHPEPLVRWQGRQMSVIADRRLARLDVAGIGRFSIKDGRRVIVDAAPHATEEEIGLWLSGAVSAVLLGQQGRFALHASTVAVQDGAVAVSGRSRSGKSTTSLVLAGRGHRLVADDVSPVMVTGTSALVEPFGRLVHVWPETYTALSLEVPVAAQPMPHSAKLALPAPSGGTTRIDAVVVIRPSRSAGTVSVDLLSRQSAVRALVGQTYRGRLLQRLWPAELLAWCIGLTSVVTTYEVTRPREGWTAPAVADAVEAVAGCGGDCLTGSGGRPLR